MYIRKKEVDSLSQLQKEINDLGMLQYMRAKKQKLKLKQKQKQEKMKSKMKKEQSEESLQVSRLPSIYEKNSSSLPSTHSNSIMQRIKQFQQRIKDLQLQNSINKRQNDRLMDQIANYRNDERFYLTPAYYPAPQPHYLHPNKPFIMSPQNQQPNLKYQQRYNQSYSSYPQTGRPENTSKSYKKKKRSISKFRVFGIVVYFTVFFPKYCKSFTLNRFDRIQEIRQKGPSAEESRTKLYQYFERQMQLDFFQRYGMDQIDYTKKQVSNSEANKKKSYKKPTDESESSSSGDSDVQKESEKSMGGKTKQSNKSNSGSNYQFELKVDAAVSFVFEYIKQSIKLIEKEDFIEKNQFVVQYFPFQFQFDQVYSQKQLKYLNQHPQKGYSRNQKAFSLFMFVKEIIYAPVVENQLLYHMGQKFYQEEIEDNTNETKLFFTFHVRTILLRIMVEQYLKKIEQKLVEHPLPRYQLRPLAKQDRESIQSESKKGKNKLLDRGFDITQSDIEEFARNQISKKQKLLKVTLEDYTNNLYQQVANWRKRVFKEIQQETLKKKFRAQDSKYFQIRKSQESQVSGLRKRKMKKEKAENASFGQISIDQRIKGIEKKKQDSSRIFRERTKNRY